jgi:phosphoglycolate phosphatase-like HAD superfamily hydrolase
VKLGEDTVDAILFDLDGTLMDTDDQAVQSLARRLKKWRFTNPQHTARSLIMATEPPGNALMTLIDILGLDNALLGLTRRLRRCRGLHNEPDFPIMPGVKDMLERLSRRYILGVVTTRGQREAETFLDQHGLRSYFQVVVTRETTWRLKPHPEPLRFAARALNVPSERCVMVGDTTVDMRAARNAGATAVGVLCGFGEHDKLEHAGAQIVIEHTSLLDQVVM